MIITPDSFNPSIEGPVIFLAGPVKGTLDWHSWSIKRLVKWVPHVHIAAPCPIKLDRRHWALACVEKDTVPQYIWETHYLNRAAQDGLILFWLEKENTHSCGRSFARTTRFELGEWKERYIRGECQIVVGIHPEFDGRQYLVSRFAIEAPELKIYGNLKATLKKAARLLRKEVEVKQVAV